VARSRDQDACPGALQVHHAADGALVRVRLPGGAITAPQLGALARIAAEQGSGALELTSRGSIQVRGIRDTDAVAEQIAAAGLLPSAPHERVRNIVSSPLSGRFGGITDVRGWVAELDTAIQADPALVGLPGRFWFSVDDGRGDVAGLRADIGVQALDDETVALLLAGVDTGVRLPAADAPATMVAVAARFEDIRGTRWRINELADTVPLLDGLTATAAAGRTFPATTRPPVGWIAQHDGRIALGAAVPLGTLPARTAEFLVAIEAPLVITPWRSVLICDLDEGVADVSLRVLAPMDLVFDENSPWLSVSACTGSPGCARSLADVRSDAAVAVAAGPPSAVHTHFVGCDRACGSPLDADVLIATGDGYRIRNRHP
jgi:precorrin-3B synthase